METLLIVLGFVAFVFGIVNFISAFRKKTDKKKSGYIIVGSLFIMAAGSILAPEPQQTSPTTVSTTIASTETSKKKDLPDTGNAGKTIALDFQKEQQQIHQELAAMEYTDQQTIDVNGGKPTFTEEDSGTDIGYWESYGDLDSLNRATYGEALLNKSLMPSEKREALTVDPTGWRNKKIDNNYLYNRSHLIGFQLTGQNNNLKNLITGTRQLNSPEMLRFESDIAYFLKQNPKKFVRYSVTPIFRENELVARGVQLQAQSINNDEISFNVYIFNIQDGVEINYADGSSRTTAEIQAENDRKAAEEQAAAQKAAEEHAAAEAEQARIAQEQQAAAAEQARIIAEQAAQQQAAQGRTVYVAPQSGKKYHFNANCRGLSNANSVVSMTESEAAAQGYGRCGFE